MRNVKDIVEKHNIVVIVTFLFFGVFAYLTYHPKEQLQSFRDQQRKADLYSLVNAVAQYAIGHEHTVPKEITTTPRAIGTGTGYVHLTDVLVPAYLVSMPHDPVNGTDADTRYSIFQDSNGRITASAASEVNPETWLSASR